MVDVNRFVTRLSEAMKAKLELYFLEELGLNVLAEQPDFTPCNDVRIADSYLTAMMGIGGDRGALIALSFAPDLADFIFYKSTEGIEIQPDEEALMRSESVAEIINIVGGLAIGNLERLDNGLSLTPPVVISQGKTIHRNRKACLRSLSFSTEKGGVKIFIISPMNKVSLTDLERGL